MRTIRARLTAWYSVALVATLALFGVALYFNPPEPSEQELDRRTERDADFARRYLEESHRVLGRLVDTEPPAALDPAIGAAFEGIHSPLVVVGAQGDVLYVNAAAREFDFAALEQVLGLVSPLPVTGAVGTVRIGPEARALRYRFEPVNRAGAEIAGLLVATPRDAAPIDPDSILGAMLVVSPIVLLAALAIGYWLAGTALRPVQGIMDEVEAITDGRSLHRRVAVPLSGDEISRLAVTLNGMLARLEQSFASLHRFTADASHELKTPLMVLRAGVERALTHPDTPAEAIESLDETLEQINWMTEMVESLLTLARADEGRAPLAVEEVDLRALLTDVAETAEMLGEQGNVKVTVEMPAEAVPLAVDPHRIRELLLNLITNAVKYTGSGGAVAVSLVDHGDSVALAVHDSGIGIAPGDLPHIFDRFWRADPARSRTGDRPGVGLGLAITKWIAEAHGGSITVQSRPGRGTVFTVTLPRGAARASH